MITKRITKGKRFKQKWLPIGWFCYDCNRFYHDDEIKQYQHQEGLDLLNVILGIRKIITNKLN